MHDKISSHYYIITYGAKRKKMLKKTLTLSISKEKN